MLKVIPFLLSSLVGLFLQANQARAEISPCTKLINLDLNRTTKPIENLDKEELLVVDTTLAQALEKRDIANQGFIRIKHFVRDERGSYAIWAESIDKKNAANWVLGFSHSLHANSGVFMIWLKADQAKLPLTIADRYWFTKASAEPRESESSKNPLAQ